MNRRTFDFFWNNGILQTINGVHFHLCSTLGSAGISKYRMSKSVADRETIFSDYRKTNQYVKDRLFRGEYHSGNLIDCHKICACIAKVLIDHHPIIFYLSNEVPQELYLSNYLIAFLASTKCLYYLTLAQLIRNKDTDKHLKLKNKKQFSYPVTNPGHDAYVLGRIKNLALNQINNIPFDILAYADMLFWIEKYNLDFI